jgi:hypothetical protein
MTKTPLSLLAACFVICALSASTSQATLIDRGGGLVYDDVLNITWLQDANYAKTTGYDADGLMNWSDANAWAANLSYYDSIRNTTYDDWRLPTVGSIGASFNYKASTDGSTDAGYGNTSPNSELSYMYYVNLGNLGYCPPGGGDANSPFTCLGAPQAGWSLIDDPSNPNDETLFGGTIERDVYWFGTEYEPRIDLAWLFDMNFGNQSSNPKDAVYYAWAVRDGDVAAATIPEPATNALLFVGIGAMILVASRRNRTFYPKVPA